MKTYEKGAIGEHKVVADLISQGYRVSKPLVDAMPYDLIVSKGNTFHTVQVKYTTRKKNYIETTPRRVRSIHKGKESNNEFDILAMYCPDTNKCYYIWSDEFKTSIRIRFGDTMNNQDKGVNYAEDYLKLCIPRNK